MTHLDCSIDWFIPFGRAISPFVSHAQSSVVLAAGDWFFCSHAAARSPFGIRSGFHLNKHSNQCGCLRSFHSCFE